MNIEDMLAQQKKLSKKRKPISSESFETLSVEDYMAEAEGNRPYSEEVAPANGKQTVSKTPINGKQTVSKTPINGKQTVSKTPINGKQTVSKTPINGKQTVSKTPINGKQTVSKTPSGIQWKICLFIFQECTKNDRRVTGPLNTEILSDYIGSSKNTIKNAIFRLKNKSLIFLVEYKDGRGGWSKYTLADSIFNQISDFVFNKNEQETVNKRLAKPTSSSSIYNNNTITTKLDLNLKKLRSLLKAKYNESILDKTLSKIHLENPKLTTDQMQESIDHFCYTIEHNPSSPSLNRKVKVASLLDALKEGRPYIDTDFRSPEQIELDRNKPSKEEISAWQLKLIDLNGEVNHWIKFGELAKNAQEKQNFKQFLKTAQNELSKHIEKKPEGAD